MPVLIPGTYPDYTKGYLLLVEAETVPEALEKYSPYIKDFFETVPASKAGFSYAPGKWTLKEMLQHIIDTERIFAYRALCIARHDKTPFPGFDQDPYVTYSEAGNRSWQNLLEEFHCVRQSTDLLIKSFTPAMLQQTGTTSNQPNSASILSFLVFGHILHHIRIIKERYL